MGAKDFYDLMSTRLIVPDPLLTLPAILVWAADPNQNSPVALLFKLPPLNVLLVWSRYSGQKTENGYDPAGDSDPDGQRQLLETGDTFKQDTLWTVTIGDDPANGLMPRGKLHLGEFWTDPTTPFFMKGRSGLIAFYHALRARHDVVQIGQKSRSMDNAALIGIPTVYIEDKQSPSRWRMQKWEEVMKDRYRWASINHPPSPLGKALRDSAINPSDPPEQQRAVANSLLKLKPLNYPPKYINTDWYTIETALEKVWKNRKCVNSLLTSGISS